MENYFNELDNMLLTEMVKKFEITGEVVEFNDGKAQTIEDFNIGRISR